MLHLTRSSISPSTLARKRRKLNTSKHFQAELPGAAGERVAGESPVLVGELHSPVELQVHAVEASTPTTKDMPLVLIVEPQVPAWA